ncbi:beta-ketoacyl-[acyl-carrier-protein] synthase family protein [Sphingobium yanoikuyae]|nr:beta-ketoacyl-[acyl-carrier-protein] synthase family protein [Sphingobium yanoikuyae]
MKRVAVTGVGAVSAAGLTADDMWRSVRDGRSGIGPLQCARQDMIATKIAAQALDFDPEVHFDPRRSGALDRFSQFAVVAAREAVAQSGLTRGDASLRAAAAIVGIGVGGMVTLDDAFYRMYGQNIARAHPLTIPKLMCNAAASQVSMDIGTHGITYAIASACASGTHAIGVAAQLVRSGACQVALTGGAEACVTAGTLIGWEALRVLANDTCRPFSRNRSGLVLGEGAGMLVLEDWDSAVARGAPILAEILGFGANADAGDLTSPDADGAADAIRLALADGGLLPEAVGYVNAHGTGTTINDRVESTALRSVFGDALPPVSSSKAVLGHALGAAGALEAVVTICALRHQVIPPTANCDQPDEELGIDMVPDGARDASFGAALSNSFAFGGLNAVLALGRA